MENNEIMFDEIEVMDDVIMEDNDSTGMNTGVAMLIGAGLTLAVGAGVKFGKKAIAAIKEKRAERKAMNVNPADEADDE